MAKLFADALSTAPQLLGAVLTHYTEDGPLSGIIVETEAYTQDDPAAHTFKGRTVRNGAMFEDAGTIYVYFTYGMHYCMNFVCGNQHDGQGVLIRALQPVQGTEIMRRNRGRSHKTPTVSDLQLANGPAKLVQALAIPPSYNGRHLSEVPLELIPATKNVRYTVGPRVGVRNGANLPRRFFITGNEFVSRPH